MTDSLKIIFLGTGAATPTIERGLPALVIQKENQNILCDCGEGTQLQLQRAGVSPAKISAVLISHIHGDHVLGLPGFINTQQLMGRRNPLSIYGPPGLQAFLDCAANISKYKPEFPLQVVELAPRSNAMFSVAGFSIVARNLDHSTPCLGYRVEEPPKPGPFNAAKAEAMGIPEGPLRAALQRGESIALNGRTVSSSEIVGRQKPGRVVAYCTDTRPCDAGIALAENCDLLVHDATFSDACQIHAEPTKHSTGREAAIVARTAGANKLALWHLSIRLRGEEEHKLLQQAREEFSNSHLAADLEHMEIQRAGGEGES